jgi:hypothetical protein
LLSIFVYFGVYKIQLKIQLISNGKFNQFTADWAFTSSLLLGQMLGNWADSYLITKDHKLVKRQRLGKKVSKLGLRVDLVDFEVAGFDLLMDPEVANFHVLVPALLDARVCDSQSSLVVLVDVQSGPFVLGRGRNTRLVQGQILEKSS